MAVETSIVDLAYTRHAREKLVRRKIEESWVEETLKYPNRTSRDGRKYWALRKLNSHTLKVVYVRDKQIKIITVYFL